MHIMPSMQACIVFFLSVYIFPRWLLTAFKTYKEEGLSKSMVCFPSLVLPLCHAPCQSIWKNYKNGNINHLEYIC